MKELRLCRIKVRLFYVKCILYTKEHHIEALLPDLGCNNTDFKLKLKIQVFQSNHEGIGRFTL